MTVTQALTTAIHSPGHTLSEDPLPSVSAAGSETIKYQEHATRRQPFNSKPEMSPTSIHDSQALPSTTQIPRDGESEAPGNFGVAMRWLVASLSFVILLPIVSVIMGLNLHGRDFQYLDESTYDGRTVTPS